MPTNLTKFARRSVRVRRTACGFTLPEVLLGAAIFAFLVTILAQATSNVSDMWVSTQKRTNQQQSERAIMDFVGRDLEEALLPIIRNDQQSLQLIRNPAGLAAAYQSGNTLFWQAPIATDSRFGDIAVVGYFVKWTGSKAVLCRLFVNPPGPPDPAKPAEAANYLVYSAPDNWITNDVIAAAAPADKDHSYLGLMAENVVGFWAEPLDAHGQVITTPADFDSRTAYTDSAGKAFAAGALPPAFRISIAILDARTAARLSSSAQANSLQTLANSSANADTFMKNVEAEPSLTPIYQGLRAYTTSIPLINSR